MPTDMYLSEPDPCMVLELVKINKDCLAVYSREDLSLKIMCNSSCCKSVQMS